MHSHKHSRHTQDSQLLGVFVSGFVGTDLLSHPLMVATQDAW